MTVQEQIIVYVVLLGAVAVSSFYFYKRLEELEEKNTMLLTEIQKQSMGITGLNSQLAEFKAPPKPVIQQPTQHEIPTPVPDFTQGTNLVQPVGPSVPANVIQPNTGSIVINDPTQTAAPAAAPQYIQDSSYEQATVFE